MMKIITQREELSDGGLALKSEKCSRYCVRSEKGAEYPIECENYAVIGCYEYCNETCLE